jgi:DnaJ homolog subfamily C member 28
MSENQNKKPEEEPTQPRRRINRVNYESAIDQQIREAMERGDFDNLRGAGKPLNLNRDPGVPEDWELAFNLLKNAGYAPDWIETRKQVDADRDKLFAPLKRFTTDPPRNKVEREETRAKRVAEFRKGAIELNRLIDTYNLKAPAPQLHLRRIRVDFEIEKFLSENK